ncbi:hypothetical protein ACLB1G_27095 [Oxalobacteraceae bacterium A2-2]
MNSHNPAVPVRFAEYLVGQMLQRRKVNFAQARLSSENHPAFHVQNGDDVAAIEVQYASDPVQAKSMWENWAGAASDVHLVIIAGNGAMVFCDSEIAPLLAPDDRTSLSLLDRQPRAEAC